MEIDEVDQKILQELEKNPRTSNKRLSEIVRLTPQAVGIRIKKMREGGILGGIKILKPLMQRFNIIKEIKRIRTGIFGFDEIIGGGFPYPAMILLVGESGTGTTVFGLRMLWEALKNDLSCAYFAVERPINHVMQQLQNFGWDVSRYEKEGMFQFVDGYKIIKSYIRDSALLANIDILNIYQEIMDQQKALIPSMNILFFDNFTELIRLAKGPPLESALIDQLGINIIKYKSDLSCFYVLKMPVISNDALLTLKSYADCVIQFRKQIVNQEIHHNLLIEKLLFSSPPPTEIKFHFTNEGIILNAQLLHHDAVQNQPSSQSNALFNIPELDYLTQGLPFGTAWLLEIDNIIPLSDILKFYVNYFIDGLLHQRICHYVPPKVSFNLLLEIFTKAFQAHKKLRKKNITLEDQLLERKIVIYDNYNQSSLFEDEKKKNLFEPFNFSSESAKNKEAILHALLGHKSEHIYYGINLSNLLDLKFDDDLGLELSKDVITIIQKRGDIALATLNYNIYSPTFVNKMEYYTDGIIRIWVKLQEDYLPIKFVQVLKRPNGNPSAAHQLRVDDVSPYIHII